MRRMTGMAAILCASSATGVCADVPKIEAVELRGEVLHVTVKHADTGWDHYANVWRVFGPDGALLAERVLLHPHETEQPFTRSTSLVVPEGVGQVSVVAECTDGDRSEPFELVIRE